MKTALVVHGHFYQLPRENPWTETVEREPSASPFHDWNERIYFECYRPNGRARIFDSSGRIERIVNNYANISFNFGPTLLSWLERKYPETYAQILAADKESLTRRGGHGNAIAQAYNHSILPLCNERDRRTQVRWGIADFRHRFGRDPESLWLPETACHDETLDTLIEEGLRYVILSPHQAERVRPVGKKQWHSVAGGDIDTTLPYKYFHSNGAGSSIVIFFYEGMIARAIAFEGALASSHGLVERLVDAAQGGGLIVHTATDGESYGHHFQFGDRCLAHALEKEAPARGFRVTNYGEFLDDNPPVMEVEIKTGPEDEGTAWSCAHGLGRWQRDCGCHVGALEGWNQAWRRPLREALDYLRDEAARAFDAIGADFFQNPWAARDDYIEVILNHHHNKESFLGRHAKRNLAEQEQVEALTLLELQRYVLLMYTSCGWFFADIAGIETIQILRYAGYILELLEQLGLPSPKDKFLKILNVAESNLLEEGNGADVFNRHVAPAKVTPRRVGAHLAISEIMEPREKKGTVAGYTYSLESLRKQRRGEMMLATGRFLLERITTGKRDDLVFALLCFGGLNLRCVLKSFPGASEFEEISNALGNRFQTASIASLLRSIHENFSLDEYDMDALLPEGREHLSRTLFRQTRERFAE